MQQGLIIAVLHPIPSMKIRILEVLEGVQGTHDMTETSFVAFR